MPRPIQALAPAFLNLLGLKNQGALPPELAEVVQPQVDMMPFYLQGTALNRWDFVNSPFPVASFQGGLIPTFVTPRDEWWYIHNLTARIAWSVLANNATNIAGARTGIVTREPSNIILGDESAEIRTATALVTFEYGCKSIRDVWVPPGSSLGLYASHIDVSTLGPNQVWAAETFCRYTPIQA